MDITTPVSGRQFAKMVGQSESAVRKAVERGSIIEGLTSAKKFIPEVAAREWGKEILPQFLNADPGTGASKTKSRKPRETGPVMSSTVEAFEREIMNDETPNVPAEDLDFDDDSPISDGMSKVEAERRIAVNKAKMADLLYKEKSGDMIPRAKLRVLFDYGATIRANFESLPDRVIDDILAAAEDRQAAKRILVEEIHRTLTGLSNIDRLNL